MAGRAGGGVGDVVEGELHGERGQRLNPQHRRPELCSGRDGQTVPIPAATTIDDRILYDQAIGILYHDADGAGGGAQIAFATGTPNLALTNSDLFLV